jgi:peroxiredoxin
MMKPMLSFCAAAALCVTFSSAALAAPEIGKPAPDFTGVDSNGKTIHLSDFKGKEVVLEWSNDHCPYVKKWYENGDMQKLQADAEKMGAVWLTILSSAPGEEGYVDGNKANEDTKTRNASPTNVILDGSGDIGHLYNAMTTPDMYVIGKDGTLDYMGGADSIATNDANDIPKAEPYAREAIEAVANGAAVKNPVTRPYGCNVKYKS